MQIIREGSRTEYSFWIIAIVDISLTIDTSLATCSSCIATCHALRLIIAFESCERLAESRRSWDEAVVYASLDSAVCCRGVCRLGRRRQGDHATGRVSLFHSDNFGEFEMRLVQWFWMLYDICLFLLAAIRLSLCAHRSPSQRVRLSKLSTGERH